MRSLWSLPTSDWGSFIFGSYWSLCLNGWRRIIRFHKSRSFIGGTSLLVRHYGFVPSSFDRSWVCPFVCAGNLSLSLSGIDIQSPWLLLSFRSGWKISVGKWTSLMRLVTCKLSGAVIWIKRKCLTSGMPGWLSNFRGIEMFWPILEQAWGLNKSHKPLLSQTFLRLCTLRVTFRVIYLQSGGFSSPSDILVWLHFGWLSLGSLIRNLPILDLSNCRWFQVPLRLDQLRLFCLRTGLQSPSLPWTIMTKKTKLSLSFLLVFGCAPQFLARKFVPRVFITPLVWYDLPTRWGTMIWMVIDSTHVYHYRCTRKEFNHVTLQKTSNLAIK